MGLVVRKELELACQLSELFLVNLELLQLGLHRLPRLREDLLIVLDLVNVKFGLFQLCIHLLDPLLKSRPFVFHFHSLVLLVVNFLIQQRPLVL